MKRLKFKNKTQKQMITYATRFMPLDILSPVSMFATNAHQKYMFLKTAEKEKEEFNEKFGLVENKEENKYGLCLGNIVHNHEKNQFYTYKSFFGKVQKKEMACVRDARPANIKEPILLSDDELKKHTQIIGTTGSGKTMLILSLMKQQIARGGGGVVVFGKGDNDMVQNLYGTALEYNRQNDFFLFDFINSNSEGLRDENYQIVNNSLNIFDVGDRISVTNLLRDIATISNKGDNWEQSAGSYLDALVKVLYHLEKTNMLFDVEKIDYILQAEDTFKEIKEYRERVNGYMLSKYFNDIRLALKLTAVLNKVYTEEGSRINKVFFKFKNTNSDIVEEKNLELSDKDRLDNSLKDMVKTQISAKINYDEMIESIIEKQDSGIDEIIEKVSGNQGAFYKIGISSGHLKSISDFFDKHELILKNKDSDINIIEAMRSGKIIVFNIPGQEPQDAELISKLIIGIFKMLVKKQGRAEKEKDTYLLVLDEINSWAKGGKDGVVGIGDIMSVARGLGMGAIIAHQSDLSSMDGATGIEKSQVEANIGTTIVLQNSDVQITETLNKKLEKEFVYYEKEVVRVNTKEDESKNIDYEMKEEDALKHNVLNALNTGQGYLIRRGNYEKMISYYSSNLKYSKYSEEIIPINKTISEEEIRKFVIGYNTK